MIPIERSSPKAARDCTNGSNSNREPSEPDRNRFVVKPLVPVTVLVLSFTAIPVELQPISDARLSWQIDPLDLLLNVLAYVPLGMVFTRLRPGRAFALAILMTLVAESLQACMMHRYPSAIDVAANSAGAVIGLLLTHRFGIGVPRLLLNRRTALSAVLGIGLIVGLQVWSAHEMLFDRDAKASLRVNPRGATAPGRLEAHWSFDDIHGETVDDLSGTGLDGTLVENLGGKALRLRDASQFVSVGNAIGLRLMGSITISAWINASSFPIDDAVIVSNHEPGFQLDTTVDAGTRTIGFKLTDPCGEVIARYGATELLRDTWYHVAGVYDAEARALNVYLNGQPDDGELWGQIPSTQEPSNANVYIGRRPGRAGYGFSGQVDDVRIYSRALYPLEIEKTMHGELSSDAPSSDIAIGVANDIRVQRHVDAVSCTKRTRPEDAFIPGLMAVSGMLLAVACAGIWPERRSLGVAVSLVFGMLMLPLTALSLPTQALWMLPLLSMIGAYSIVSSEVSKH